MFEFHEYVKTEASWDAEAPRLHSQHGPEFIFLLHGKKTLN